MASKATKKIINDLLNEAIANANKQYNVEAAQVKQNAADSVKTMLQNVNDQMIGRGLSRSTLPVTIGSDNQATIEKQKNSDLASLGLQRDSNISTARNKYTGLLLQYMNSGGGKKVVTPKADPAVPSTLTYRYSDEVPQPQSYSSAIYQPYPSDVESFNSYEKRTKSGGYNTGTMGGRKAD